MKKHSTKEKKSYEKKGGGQQRREREKGVIKSESVFSMGPAAKATQQGEEIGGTGGIIGNSLHIITFQGLHTSSM